MAIVLSIVTLPCPAPVEYEGSRLPASYANFYIANEVVLVPVFDDPNDDKALGILQELFPERQVVGLALQGCRCWLGRNSLCDAARAEYFGLQALTIHRARSYPTVFAWVRSFSLRRFIKRGADAPRRSAWSNACSCSNGT